MGGKIPAIVQKYLDVDYAVNTAALVVFLQLRKASLPHSGLIVAAPIFAATWMSDDGWEVSGKFMYNIKRKNKDFRLVPGMPKMDYESGDDFHMDYVVGKHFGPWAVGLSGYYLKQTENDKLEGETLPEVPGVWSKGRKGEVFAIGPSVSYTNKNGTMFIAQWHHETEAENRFRGDKAWFKLVLPF